MLQRKRVTVLFSDVIASTALGEGLDPETLRGLLARYFETAKDVVERHGGTVEKFIGDAVMAVFGVPTLHEDDAWRAARAAAALRDAITSLNDDLAREYGTRLALRIGVNTGEVVTGTDERLATGDAVNLAARLEQAAAPNEILLGEGITYWPVVEVVRQLEPRLPQLALDPHVLATLRGLLGEEETTDSTEEIAFAVRKLLEAAARRQPLVCVFDDIQWGEPAFLDLIEQVTTLSRDAPILLCCIARRDLLEQRPGWGSTPNATTVALEGLSGDETDTLIETVAAGAPLPAPLRERIREAAEGNPLFVEEMIGLLRDAPDGEVTVPPTIQALLATRLDQLDPAERA